jgi:hypothetical protein
VSVSCESRRERVLFGREPFKSQLERVLFGGSVSRLQFFLYPVPYSRKTKIIHIRFPFSCLRPSLTVYAHADKDAFLECNFLSLSLMETPKTKMPTLLDVPPGTRPTEKELLLRWPTKTNEVALLMIPPSCNRTLLIPA